MKRALVVGINYVGTGNDLKGCLNDAKNMQALLIARGFEVEMVLEAAATTAGIKAGLARLVKGAVPGDVLVFHYSGHGSQLPSKAEADGYEEIICPIDLNWTDKVIADKDLKAIFDPVPHGVNVTLILDCCHSGDGLNQTEVMPAAKAISTDETAPAESRYLEPPASVLADLETRTLVDWKAERDVNTTALLIAGCHSNQTSADAYINGVYQGAATAAILKAVAASPQITYRALVNQMTDFMVAGHYEQRPELDGFNGLYDAVFAEPFFSVADPVSVAAPVPMMAAPQVPAKKKDTFTVVVAAIVIVTIFALAFL